MFACIVHNVPLVCRRSGYNGKSTILSLLQASLGDYTILTDAALYYKADRTKSIDDHSAGLMVFEKKRLALMEETSSSASFAEDKVICRALACTNTQSSYSHIHGTGEKIQRGAHQCKCQRCIPGR